MTSQTAKDLNGWWRVATGGLALGAVAAGAIAVMSAPSTLADPATPTPTTAAATPTMTADQALAIIAQDYDTGAGGGQLSNLVHTVLKLRAQGYMPSNSNKMAIQAALDKRPNQAPLIAALQETIDYQRKMAARQQNAQAPSQSQSVLGVGQIPPNQVPPGTTPGVTPGSPGGINIPIPIG